MSGTTPAVEDDRTDGAARAETRAETAGGQGHFAQPERPRRLPALLSRYGAVLPLPATVLLLCAPADRTSLSGGSGITLADAGSAVLVAWCLLRMLPALRRARHAAGGVRHGGGSDCGGRALTPLGALVLGAPAVAFAAATVASEDPAASLPGFVRYLQLFVLVPGAVLLSLRDARDARLLCGAVVATALVEGVVGVAQAVSGTGASYMGDNVRAVGTFGALDVMGMATVVSYGLLTALALGLNPPAGAPRWLRPCALGCAAGLVVPLALSYSRGAWIATSVAGLLVLLLRGARTAVPAVAALAAAAVVLVGGFGVASAQLGERVSSITEVSAAPDRSVTDRYSLWSAATRIWQDAPAAGVGLKGFPEHRDSHAGLGLSSGSDAAGAGLSFQKEPLLSPHNMYLLVLSEQGLIGVVALVGGWAALLVCAARRLREARRGGGTGSAVRRAGGAADCGTVVVGLLVWQSIDFLYGDIGGPSTVLTSLMLGLAAWWATAADAGGPDRPAGAGAAGEGGAAR